MNGAPSAGRPPFRRTRTGLPLADHYGLVWTHLLFRHPVEQRYGPVKRHGYRWRPLPDLRLVVVQYLTRRSVGVFVRGERRVLSPRVIERLRPHEDRLAAALGAAMTARPPYLFLVHRPADHEDDATWDELADWLHATANRYEAELRAVIGAS